MISDVYFPRINGVSTSIQTFRRDLARQGHDTLLIAPDYGGGGGSADLSPGQPAPREEGLPMLRMRSRAVPRDPEDRIMSPGQIRRLAPWLRAQRFDVIHIQTPFVAHYAGVALARALQLPVVETYHTYFEEYLHHYVPLLPRALTRFVARRFTCSQAHQVNRLIAPSCAMQDALRAYGVRTPIEVIPTGLEADRFVAGDGAGFRTRAGIDPLQPVLVHVGRIAHEKNIDFLLRVLVRVRAAVPEVMMLVAGEGPALAHCRRLVEALGIAGNVTFAGYLDRRRELLDCYRAGDLFVFASRTETQGLVLLEAMAQGIPVVSTAHMGTVDVLGPGRGCVVVEEGEAQFAASVVELLRDRALRMRLGRDAEAYARGWSATQMAVRLGALYREVCGPVSDQARPDSGSDGAARRLNRPAHTRPAQHAGG
jgi:glycosyltransferase involved in cell wall biosynthesis